MSALPTLRAAQAVLSVLASLALRSAAEPAAPPPESAPRAIELGASLERDLTGGEIHRYALPLSDGQLLRVSLEQQGVDAVLTLEAPNGAPLVSMDAVRGPLGAEELRWEASESGGYVLKVGTPPSQAAALGKYTLRIDVAAGASAADRAWIAAQAPFVRGRRGQAEGRQASMEDAVDAFGEAAASWREAGDARWQATALLNRGAVRFRLHDAEGARDEYLEALHLERQFGDRRFEGTALSNLANAYTDLGERVLARETYERALAIRREVQDRFGEAATLANLGNVYKEEGEYETARVLYEQALALTRELKLRGPEGVALSSVGNVYAELGQFERGRVYFEQALAISREVKDRRREAIGYTNLAVCARGLEQYELARDYNERALLLWRDVGDRSGLALTLNNLGDVYSRLERYEQARDCYAEALANAREIKERSGEATALGNLGIAYRHLGDPARAREHAEQALAIARELNARPEEATHLYQLAVLARARGDLTAALDNGRSALELAESLRTAVGASDLQSSFFASVQDYFGLVVDVHMRRHRQDPAAGDDVAAFEVSERARARGLLDLLAEARSDIRTTADPQLAAHERELQRKLNAAAEEQQQLMARPHTAEEAASAERDLARLTAEQQALQAQIRRANPRYASLLEQQPLTLRGIQSQLLDDDTLLLVYSLGTSGAEHGYLWAITPSRLDSFELPQRAALETTARRFLEQLTQARGGDASTRAAAAAALSDAVLGPVAAQLGHKRLIVVSDGVLQYVPFAALPAPGTTARANTERPPLVVDHEIVYEPSASSLSALRRELAGRKPAAKALAVLADPVFSGDDERVRASARLARLEHRPQVAGVANATRAGERAVSPLPVELESTLQIVRVRAGGTAGALPRLLFARREAEAIAAIAPTGSAMKALDFQASRATVGGGELAHYRIVHFATHGLLNAQHPELSGLVLSLVDEQGRKQDGFLRLDDVYKLDLPAELVVLSACQTGLGAEIRGEGLVGLTRGFMYAGAARVVASLWQVDDVATSELMRRFYLKLLRENQRPAAALRAAQVEMWRTGTWRSPYYWAGFVLQGEWR